MKLAYLSILSAPAEPAVSGVFKVSETLLREYEMLTGLEVDVVTLINGLREEQQVRRGNVCYHYIPCKPRGKTATFYLWETCLLRRRIRELGPDLVHGQPSAEYLLAATGCGLPHVITLHGLSMRETRGMSLMNPWLFAGAVREHLQNRAVQRARNIISISSYVDDYLRGWWKGRLWHIPNPIEPDFFSLAAPDRKGLRMICVGAVYERKNQAYLVKTCRILAEQGVPFECHIIGRVNPGFEEKIGGMIRAYGLERQVILKGIVSREELFSEYAWSNAVVLPSLEETSPLSLIQGMACGRCVFGADAAGIPALLQSGTYGTLFSPVQEKGFSSELRRFLDEPQPFWERAERGRQFAGETFRPSAVARKTVEVYQHILGERAAPG